jgi:hypothetical protein
MKTVSVNFQDDDLERLDAWAASKRLKRNGAILALLDLALAYQTIPNVNRDPSMPNPEHSRNLGVVLHSPPGPMVDLKSLKLATGKAVLGAAQDYVGVKHVAAVGDQVVEEWPADEKARDEFYGKMETPAVLQKNTSRGPEGWEDPP